MEGGITKKTEKRLKDENIRRQKKTLGKKGNNTTTFRADVYI
jgi:hypothetical protein